MHEDCPSLCRSSRPSCVEASVSRSFAFQPNCSYPLIDQSCILASAEMMGMIDSTGKDLVVNCSTSPFKPRKQTCPDVGCDLELYNTTRPMPAQ